MDTSNSKSNTNEPTQQPDPLALAAKAMSSFQSAAEDLSDTVRNGPQNRWREAMLVTAYAQAAELRAIRNMLAGAYTLFVAEMQERNDDAA